MHESQLKGDPEGQLNEIMWELNMFAYKTVDETDTREYQYTDLEGNTPERCRESGEGRR